MTFKIVALSDTHSFDFTGRLAGLEADLLILAGDMTNIGTPAELVALDEMIGEVKHQFRLGVLFIAGNHDRLCFLEPAKAKHIIKNATYLENESIELDGIKFWGSPNQPFINNFWVFGESDERLREIYESIPDDTDVVITHGAPLCAIGQYFGCPILRDRVLQIKPKAHLFGHLHTWGGRNLHFNDVRFYNVAMCDDQYNFIGEPTIIEI